MAHVTSSAKSLNVLNFQNHCVRYKLSMCECLEMFCRLYVAIQFHDWRSVYRNVLGQRSSNVYIWRRALNKIYTQIQLLQICFGTSTLSTCRFVQKCKIWCGIRVIRFNFPKVFGTFFYWTAAFFFQSQVCVHMTPQT